MSRSRQLSRRGFLGGLAGASLRLRAARAAGPDHGRIRPPVPPPDVPVIRHEGIETTLPRLLAQRVTALQVMFTACRTTCPLEGAIFQRVQRLIPDQVSRGIQLVSLSVDPGRDTSGALARWLRRFQARPGWIAAAPRPAGLEAVRAFFGAGRSASDGHTTQVQLFDRTGALIWRTGELPEAEEVAALLARV